MRRKHNPRVALVALLLLAFIMTWICGGCAVQAEAAENYYARFTTDFAGTNIRIITDNETGVQYLAYGNTYGLGITKLEAE